MHFLALPIELRLEVYGHCSSFELLHISHTSSQLYREVNSFPEVVRTSHGHSPPHSQRYAKLLARAKEHGYTKSFGKTELNHSIFFVGHLRDEEEVRFFKRLYWEGRTVIGWHDALLQDSVFLACSGCFYIGTMWGFCFGVREEYKDSEHDMGKCVDCCGHVGCIENRAE